jgi:SAM-dependent methyltransferase
MNSSDERSTPIDAALRERRCPICGAELDLHAAEYPGYRAPARFDCFSCPSCGVCAAWPNRVDDALYDLIYQLRDEISLYGGYAEQARDIVSARDPLGFLTRLSPIYWAVAQAIRERRPATLLEVGSGLGYLTHALRKTGIDAHGTDLSQDAVDEARSRFGPFFAAEPLDAIRDAGRRYGMVVMTEVIEHVPDPYALLRQAFGVLAPGGTVVLTTPNRDYFPPEAIWQTEPPPVHLWWFSERSLALIAKELGASISFTDFRPYNRRHPDLYTARLDMRAPRGPVIAEDGTVVPHHDPFRFPPAVEAVRAALRRSGLLRVASRSAVALARLVGTGARERRSATLAAMLRPAALG